MRLRRRRKATINQGPRQFRDDDEARTIGDMKAEEFFEGMGTAVGSALESALGRVGAGTVNRDDLAPTTLTDEDEAPPSNETARQKERRELKETRVFALEGARAWYQFEKDPEIRNLPTAAEREFRTMEYFDCHDWAVAVSAKDYGRANKIALLSYPRHLQRALSTGAGSGGALVPTILEGPIIEKRAVRDKITPLSDQRRVSSGTLDVSVEGTLVTAAGFAENAAITEGSPTYDPISLRLKKSAALVISSREEVEDASAAMQLVRNLSSQAGRALGTYNNTENILGDGTGVRYTDGIIANASIAAVAGTAGAMTRATYLDLLFDMLEEYTDNLVWLQSRAMSGFASRLEDTAGNSIYPNAHLEQSVPVTADGPRRGQGEIEGIPVVQITDVGSIIVLANLDFFVSLMDDGIRVETTTEGGTAWVNDQQQWKFVQRQDGAVTLPAAFRKTDGAVTVPV